MNPFPSMPLRPTLQDVARAAGVGKTTVSLALRNNPKIPDATRKRVQTAAQQLGYRPDPALARIAAYRWRTRETDSGTTIAYIAMKHPWSGGESHSAARRGAAEQADALGYRFETFRYEDYNSPENLGRVLYNRGIPGVLVGQVFVPNFAERFPWEQFAAVGCNIGYHRPPVHLVMPDLAHAVHRAWTEALRVGARRIGVALLAEPQAVDRFEKLSALYFCQRHPGAEGVESDVRSFPLRAIAEFSRWLDTFRPEVVLGFNNSVYWWLREAGRRVPENVRFVSLDTDHIEEPHIAGLSHNYTLLGRTAMDFLDVQIRQNHVGPPAHPIILEVESAWCDGVTLGSEPAENRMGSGAAPIDGAESGEAESVGVKAGGVRRRAGRVKAPAGSNAKG
jgi:LacI family transcriptional regulator